MNTSMILISMHFLEKIKGFPLNSAGKVECDESLKKEVMHDVGSILYSRTVSKDTFLELFDRVQKEGVDPILFMVPSDILSYYRVKFKRSESQSEDQLLKMGAFYYHPRLQIVPPPPVLKLDDRGLIADENEEEEFYLEIVDSFTIDNLVDYYNSKFRPRENYMKERVVGALKHVMQHLGLDMMLFLIDEAYSQLHDSNRMYRCNPLEMQEFEDDARHVYENRKNISFQGGFDHVIARRK